MFSILLVSQQFSQIFCFTGPKIYHDRSMAIQFNGLPLFFVLGEINDIMEEESVLKEGELKKGRERVKCVEQLARLSLIA